MRNYSCSQTHWTTKEFLTSPRFRTKSQTLSCPPPTITPIDLDDYVNRLIDAVTLYKETAEELGEKDLLETQTNRGETTIPTPALT